MARTCLMLLALLVVAADAAEPTSLTFQQASVAKAVYDAEAALYGEPGLYSDRILRALLDKHGHAQ